jgi:hypothetical protein
MSGKCLELDWALTLSPLAGISWTLSGVCELSLRLCAGWRTQTCRPHPYLNCLEWLPHHSWGKKKLGQKAIEWIMAGLINGHGTSMERTWQPGARMGNGYMCCAPSQEHPNPGPQPPLPVYCKVSTSRARSLIAVPTLCPGTLPAPTPQAALAMVALCSFPL